MTKVEAYIQALKTGDKQFNTTGLCGRVIRGTKLEDFITLTDDPDRKLIMIMGSDGLKRLLGKNGYEILIDIGYEPDYIVRKVTEGNQFKLVVFEEGKDACLATWDNVADIVSRVYPDTKEGFNAFTSILKTTNFDNYEKTTGMDWSEIDKVGKSDVRFITYEKFCAISNRTVVSLRSFLYFTVHLRELFSGDGYTYDSNGNRGLMEYICENKRIDSFSSFGFYDFNVQLNGGNKMENKQVGVLGIDDIEAKNTSVDDLGTENVNLIFVGVDASGSMNGYVNDMITELTEFKNAILNSKEVDEILLARADFRDRADIKGYKKVADFETTYDADGGTALYDTIVRGTKEMVNYVENYLKKQGMRVKCVFAIFSDGEDTASRETFQNAKQAVAELNTKEVVTAFICFGSAATIATDLGFKNILTLGKSQSDLRKAFNCLSKSVISNSKSVVNKTVDFFDVT